MSSSGVDGAFNQRRRSTRSPSTTRSTAKTIGGARPSSALAKAATSASVHALLKRMLPARMSACSHGARSTCSTGRQPCELGPLDATAAKLAPITARPPKGPKPGGGCRTILRSSSGAGFGSASRLRHSSRARAK